MHALPHPAVVGVAGLLIVIGLEGVWHVAPAKKLEILACHCHAWDRRAGDGGIGVRADVFAGTFGRLRDRSSNVRVRFSSKMWNPLHQVRRTACAKTPSHVAARMVRTAWLSCGRSPRSPTQFPELCRRFFAPKACSHPCRRDGASSQRCRFRRATAASRGAPLSVRLGFLPKRKG